MVKNLFKKLFILTIILSNSFLIGQTAYANWSGSTATGAEDSDPSVTINFTAAADGSGGTVAALGVLQYTVMGTGTANNQGDGYADYNLNSGSLSLAGGVDDVSATIDLNVVNDDRYELNETIVIQLTSGTGNIDIGSTNQITFTITDDEALAPPTISFSLATVTGDEGTTTTITVSREESGSEFG